MEVIVEFDQPNIWTFNDKEDDPIHIIVRGVEADVNAHGWDNHARLGVVLSHQMESKDGGSAEAFAVCEVPMFSAFYSDPATGLSTLNSALLRDFKAVNDLANSVLAPIKDEFLGWILISESWFHFQGNNVVTHEQSEKDKERVESRICVLVLRDGRVVQLNRLRGKEGELDKLEVYDSISEDAPVPGGFVIWNLVVLTRLSEEFIKLMGDGTKTGLF